MKRFFSIVLVCIVLITSASVGFVYADDTPTFGGGFNNYARQESKVAAVLSSMLQYSGISMSDSNYLGDPSSETAQWTYSAIQKIKNFDGGRLYNKIIDDTSTSVVFQRGKMFINFETPSWLPTDLDDLYIMLFGENALSGDPVNTTLQTQYSIDVDGVDVIPWRSNLGLAGNPITNTNWVLSRGDFIPMYQGAYMSMYNDIYNSNSPAAHQKTFSFDVMGTDGQYHTITTRRFYARTWTASEDSNHHASGRDFRIRRADDSNWIACWYMYDDFASYDDTTCPAWLWVMNSSETQLWLMYYSYVYSGTFIPGSWGNNSLYAFVPCANPNFTPKKIQNGSFEVSSPGYVQINDMPTSIIVNGNSYQDVVNNYVEGDLYITNNYTDPNTWDTSQHGTATDDGNGGFNFDFDGFHLPDLNIDWSLDGLTEKFPFSIPFDIIRFFSILNTEPEAPSVSGDIDLGITVWHIDFDFSEYDSIAELFRNLVYIFFVICLIVYTRDFLKR